MTLWFQRLGTWLFHDFPVWFLLTGVRGYQIILGPFLGGHCRYVPSCSNYCLLYTSPSPRDRTRSRMPSSA